MTNLFLTLKLIWQGWSNYILDLISDIKYKKYFNARKAICDVCEDNKHGMCQLCGCFINAKTMAEDAECPVQKWLTIPETLKNESK